MESIKSALFDNPLPVYIALAPLELIFLVLFVRQRTLRRGLLLASPSVLAILVTLTAAYVPTDRKAIFAAANEICADMQAGKDDALKKHLDSKFAGMYHNLSINKSEAIDAAKLARQQFSITEIRLLQPQCKLDIQTPKATMTAVTIMAGSHELGGSGNWGVTFELTWVKGADGVWRISQAQEPR